MVVLPPESNVLARQAVKGPRYIPRLIRIAGILGEIRCSRSGRRAVKRRQQQQVPYRIVDLSAANRQTVLVSIEPEAVVEHVAQEALFRAFFGISRAAYSASVLASHVSGQRECSLAYKILRLVVILNLDAVVRVIAHAARRVQRILTQGVLISQHR